MSSQTPPPAGTGACLVLNSPLDDDSLDRLLEAATAHRPSRIADYGCGWGEVLLRALSLVPDATGFGVDQHEPDIRRAEATAARRGLASRVELVVGTAAEHRRRADLLVSMGAYQAFGDVAAALRTLREDVEPGGRALFGAEYWTATPAAEELAHMWPGASVADCTDLPGLVDAAHAAGWRVLDLHDTTRQEFDAYEVGHLREREEWLLEHPGHDLTGDLDRAWTSWLRGHRRTMGFVTLLLGPVQVPDGGHGRP